MTELTGEGQQSLRQRRHRGVRGPQRAVGHRPGQPGRSPDSAPAWFDFDNDGRLDLLSVNGAVQIDRGAAAGAAIRSRCTRRSCCFAISAAAASRTSPRAPARRSRCRKSAAARRLATSTTTATSTCWSATTTARARLLINQAAQRQSLARAAAASARTRRATCSARASRSSRTGGPSLWRRARADGSYASANDPRVLVGLGDVGGPSGRARAWPSGRIETLDAACPSTATRR